MNRTALPAGKSGRAGTPAPPPRLEEVWVHTTVPSGHVQGVYREKSSGSYWYVDVDGSNHKRVEQLTLEGALERVIALRGCGSVEIDVDADAFDVLLQEVSNKLRRGTR